MKILIIPSAPGKAGDEKSINALAKMCKTFKDRYDHAVFLGGYTMLGYPEDKNAKAFSKKYRDNVITFYKSILPPASKQEEWESLVPLPPSAIKCCMGPSELFYLWSEAGQLDSHASMVYLKLIQDIWANADHEAFCPVVALDGVLFSSKGVSDALGEIYTPEEADDSDVDELAKEVADAINYRYQLTARGEPEIYAQQIAYELGSKKAQNSIWHVPRLQVYSAPYGQKRIVIGRDGTTIHAPVIQSSYASWVLGVLDTESMTISSIWEKQ